MKTKKIFLIGSLLLVTEMTQAQWQAGWTGTNTNLQYNQNAVGINLPSGSILSGTSLDIGTNMSLRGGHLVFNTTNSAVINWGSTGNGHLLFRRLSTQGTYSSGFNTYMMIANDGEVGIGTGVTSTNDPVSLLHVSGDVTFGSATNRRKWRWVTQNWIDYGKMFLYPDNASGAADPTKAFTINPDDRYTSFTFGHEENLTRTTIGKATGMPNYGTTYLGFNAIYNETNDVFEREDNGAANGGAVVWSNVNGHLCFSSMPSDGSTGNASSAASVYDNRSMQIMRSSTGTPQVLIGKDNFSSGTHLNDYSLAVDGKIVAKEIYVTTQNWPDYVFKNDYALMPLSEVKNYIDQNSHLPGVPSAAEVEATGINAAETDKLLLKKIEELTLYILEQENRILELEKKVSEKE